MIATVLRTTAGIPSSLEGVLARLPASLVDQNRAHAASSLSNLINCDGEHAKRQSRGLGVVRAGVQDVECLGQQRGKVIVIRVHDDPSSPASLQPERTGNVCSRPAEIDRPANAEGQLDPQPLERHRPVLALRSPLARLGADSGRAVGQDHRGLDLVAILPPRTRSPRHPDLTLRWPGPRDRARRDDRPLRRVPLSVRVFHEVGHSGRQLYSLASTIDSISASSVLAKLVAALEQTGQRAPLLLALVQAVTLGQFWCSAAGVRRALLISRPAPPAPCLDAPAPACSEVDPEVRRMARPRWRRLTITAVKSAVAIVVLWAVGRHVLRTYGDLRGQSESLHFEPVWLVAGGLSLSGGPPRPAPCSTSGFCGRSSTPIGFVPAWRAYIVSHLGKYVPGKAMVVVSAIRHGRPVWRPGVDGGDRDVLRDAGHDGAGRPGRGGRVRSGGSRRIRSSSRSAALGRVAASGVSDRRARRGWGWAWCF